MVPYQKCLHEQGVVDWDQVCPDHYPLNIAEIRELLSLAVEESHPQQRMKLRERLCQGIVGMTCPPPNEGPIAEKMGKVDQLFVQLTTGWILMNELLVLELNALLNA